MALVQMIRGPVAARPPAGRQSVLIHADEQTVEMSGHCGVCGDRVSGRLAGEQLTYDLAGRRRFLLGPRPSVILGESLPCRRCGYPVTWMTGRSQVRQYERQWTRARASSL